MEQANIVLNGHVFDCIKHLIRDAGGGGGGGRGAGGPPPGFGGIG